MRDKNYIRSVRLNLPNFSLYTEDQQEYLREELVDIDAGLMESTTGVMEEIDEEEYEDFMNRLVHLIQCISVYDALLE